MSKKIDGLYYITHIDNLPSILENGILSHNSVEQEGIDYTPIYDSDIVSRRRNIKAPNQKSLWEFANLYLQPRNPMLYRVMHESSQAKIAVIKIRKDVISLQGSYMSDGNAAHRESKIMPVRNDELKRIKKKTDVEYWKDTDGSKRKIMAEVLIPDRIPTSFIECIYVAIDEIKKRVEDKLKGRFNINVIAERYMFFRSINIYHLAPKLLLEEGDMFFSRQQTLTISVNTIGVMGKGLAARAKYQFPDVYVQYEELCKRNKLKTGKPELIKSEMSLESNFSEYPSSNDKSTWFLLFPTKKHWREKSKLHYITDGMQWVKENYRDWGIQSLALPALGCGLGGLKWEEVGPIMCRAAYQMDIVTSIYLPTEKKVPERHLEKDFLIGKDLLNG